MTHIFEVTSGFLNLVSTDRQTFDILNFGPRVSIGDTVIYQRLADMEDEETEQGEANDTSVSGDEISVKIESLFEDADKCLKKGLTAFGFKIKEA